MSTFIHSIFDFFKQIFESIYYELILSSLSRDFLDNKIVLTHNICSQIFV